MTSLRVISCKLLFKLAIILHFELYPLFPLVCYTIFDFEDHDLSNWTLNGTAFNNQPTYGDNPSERFKTKVNGRNEPSNHRGDWWIGTFENRPNSSHPAGEIQGDEPQGNMMSPSFSIDTNFLRFLIGAGCKDVGKVRAELIVNGDVIFETRAEEVSANCIETMSDKSWNVSGFTGSRAHQVSIEISMSYSFAGSLRTRLSHVVSTDLINCLPKESQGNFRQML